jgi:hypothetical protein
MKNELWKMNRTDSRGGIQIPWVMMNSIRKNKEVMMHTELSGPQSI